MDLVYRIQCRDMDPCGCSAIGNYVNFQIDKLFQCGIAKDAIEFQFIILLKFNQFFEV